MGNKETADQRDARRREELNKAAKAGREAKDPKWLARDEAWTRSTRPRND